MAGKSFHYQAGFAIGVGMQYECRLRVLLLVDAHQLTINPGISRAQLLIAEGFQGAGVVSPAAFHFNPHIEIYLATESFFHILARRASNQLELFTIAPNDDRLMARLVDND